MLLPGEQGHLVCGPLPVRYANVDFKTPAVVIQKKTVTPLFLSACLPVSEHFGQFLCKGNVCLG